MIPAAPGWSHERQVDRLTVRTLPDRDQLGRHAASAIAAAMRQGLAEKPRLRMVFACAPSQAETLACLSQAPELDWSRVEVFHMDEYIGLPDGAPQRFAAWLHEHLVDRVRPGFSYFIVPGADPAGAAAQYAAQLAQAPIDIVCLGIGVNGHLAFNDPPVADFGDPLDMKVVELEARCRQQQVDDGAFDDLSQVPRQALTLTVPRLVNARRLFCVVPGAAKREAVQAALHGPVSTHCPASILRQHADCTLFLDRDSDCDA